MTYTLCYWGFKRDQAGCHIGSCVSMTSFVANKACLWKANKATFVTRKWFFCPLLRERVGFFYILTSTFHFNICNSVGFEFYSTKQKRFLFLFRGPTKVFASSVMWATETKSDHFQQGLGKARQTEIIFFFENYFKSIFRITYRLRLSTPKYDYEKQKQK